MEWQFIKTAPRDGRTIIAFWQPTASNKQIDDNSYGMARWSKIYMEWTDAENEENIWSEPTHWMPLPPPPEPK
jgi:hypothetical protein